MTPYTADKSGADDRELPSLDDNGDSFPAAVALRVTKLAKSQTRSFVQCAAPTPLVRMARLW